MRRTVVRAPLAVGENVTVKVVETPNPRLVEAGVLTTKSAVFPVAVAALRVKSAPVVPVFLTVKVVATEDEPTAVVGNGILDVPLTKVVVPSLTSIVGAANAVAAERPRNERTAKIRDGFGMCFIRLGIGKWVIAGKVMGRALLDTLERGDGADAAEFNTAREGEIGLDEATDGFREISLESVGDGL